MRVNNSSELHALTRDGGAKMSRREKAIAAAEAEKNRKAFFAANGQTARRNDYAQRIENRRRQAKKEIKKLVGDVWDNDRKLDNDMIELKNKSAELKSENKDLRDTIKNSEQEREAFKAEYGIADDSEEQRELELLQRASERIPDLSMEEWDKYNEITARGLTDYQQRSMEKYRYEVDCREKLRGNESEIEGNFGTVRATKQARLESDPMLEAQEAADKIAAAASKDIAGMLKQEAIDHVNEENEKKLEEAKKQKEKKEEEEERISERKEKREAIEKQIEELTEKLSSSSISEDVKKDVQELLDRLKLLDEDIKGSLIDANI